MTLLELITDFDEVRGHTSLTGEEKLFFLNQASRTLDNMVRRDHQKTRFPFKLSSGKYQIILPEGVRAIDASWIGKSDGSNVRMLRKELTWIYTNYPNLGSDDQSPGTPKYWDLMYQDDITRGLGTAKEVKVRASLIKQLVNLKSHQRAVIIAPPPDTSDMTLIFWGTRFTPKLSKVNQANFWSDNYTSALIFAAMFHFDARRRDISSANNWLGMVKAEIDGYKKDLVATATRDVPMQLSG